MMQDLHQEQRQGKGISGSEDQSSQFVQKAPDIGLLLLVILLVLCV